MKEDRESAVKRTSTPRPSKGEQPASARKTRAAQSGDAASKPVNGVAADAPRKATKTATRGTGAARKATPAGAAAAADAPARRRTRTVLAPQHQAATTAAENEAAAAPDVATPSAEERHRMIEQIAYFRAQWRGWTPGAELEDWLHAERVVEEMLRRPPSD